MVVNITDVKGKDDHSCLLSNTDYSILSKPSVVYYKMALAVDAIVLDKELAEQKNLMKLTDCPADTVAKIVAGAKISDELTAKYLKYLLD